MCSEPLTANALYSHSKSRTTNWILPDRLTWNRMDLILPPRSFKFLSMDNTRISRGTLIASDCGKVLTSLKWKVRKGHRSNILRIGFQAARAEHFKNLLGQGWRRIRGTGCGRLLRTPSLKTSERCNVNIQERVKKEDETNDILKVCDEKQWKECPYYPVNI